MSVNFYTAATIQADRDATFRVACWAAEDGACDYVVAEGLPFEQAAQFVVVACPEHGEHQAFPDEETPRPLSVSVASGRAARMFGYLGLDGQDQWDGGAMEATEFRARCFAALRALTPEDDGGAPDIEVDEGVVFCGQRAGYWADRIGDLIEVADLADEHDGMVMWS